MDCKSQLMILACFCVLISGQLVAGVCDTATEVEQTTFIGCAAGGACLSFPPGIVGEFDSFAQLGGNTCTVTVANGIATATGLAGPQICFGFLTTCVAITTVPTGAGSLDSDSSSLGGSSSR